MRIVPFVSRAEAAGRRSTPSPEVSRDAKECRRESDQWDSRAKGLATRPPLCSSVSLFPSPINLGFRGDSFAPPRCSQRAILPQSVNVNVNTSTEILHSEHIRQPTRSISRKLSKLRTSDHRRVVSRHFFSSAIRTPSRSGRRPRRVDFLARSNGRRGGDGGESARQCDHGIARAPSRITRGRLHSVRVTRALAAVAAEAARAVGGTRASRADASIVLVQVWDR